MKIYIYILLLFLIPQSHDVVGSYQMNDKLNFDSLEIKKDNTYIYKHRGDSCWMWSDSSGKWEVKNNILILNEINSYLENSSEENEQSKMITKNYIHKFKIGKNKLISLESKHIPLNKKYKKFKKSPLSN